MIRLIVLDDNSLDLKIIRKKLKEFDHNYEISCYTNSKAMFADILNCKDQLIFMIDVLLKEENGINIAKKIQEIFSHAPIIFMSAYLDTATEVYDVEHCYYVYKMQLDEKLPLALRRAFEYIQNNNQKLVLELKDRKVFIPMNEIIYLERDRRTTYIHCSDETYSVSQKLREIQLDLPLHFICCHASYLVNLSYMKECERTQIILKNGNSIPVSRSHLHEVNKAIHQFIIKQ